ncbi:MAG: MotA/TolQ/ExbB proton channel family protein, partial [Pirellulales bacterium]|nr:MotA/TolQ/ExbB proton channel family protein [Pirellulales bacterium]
PATAGPDMSIEDSVIDFFGSLFSSPILWGSLASAVFYCLIYFDVINNGYVRDYFAGHPVEYVTTVMFFVGMAALLITAFGTLRQSAGLGGYERIFGPVPAGGQPVSDCPSLLARLREAGSGRENDIMMRRFREALDRIMRRNSAEGLEDELKYLADRDADRVYESYALFRVIIWAIPVLGFLGTVIGITLAIGNLNPSALEESIDQVVMALRIAFATTTQALSLSIVLMFTKYLVGQAENNLLGRIDRQVDDELLGRFQVSSRHVEGQLGAVRSMAAAVIDSSEQLLQRQVDLWQSSIHESQESWKRIATSAGEEVQTALSGALKESLREHARTLVEAEQAHTERNRESWALVQESLSEGAKATNALQSSVKEQVQILYRTVEATGQVARLEETLNRNLAALAGSKNFEQTVMSLAAAIHLLNARLGNDVGGVSVQLEPERQDPQAA